MKKMKKMTHRYIYKYIVTNKKCVMRFYEKKNRGDR